MSGKEEEIDVTDRLLEQIKELDQKVASLGDKINDFREFLTKNGGEMLDSPNKDKNVKTGKK